MPSTAAMAITRSPRSHPGSTGAPATPVVTVTVHSLQAAASPSDTVTFTVYVPGVAREKLNEVPDSVVAVPSTLHVYVSASPSGTRGPPPARSR